MCTVSWSLANRRLSLCFNRDERKSRPEALPPQVHDIDGLQVLAPVDPAGGGSWIAVNEKGLCSFVLNNYVATAKFRESSVRIRSRGEIPMHLVKYGTLEEAVPNLEQWDWTLYNPFLLGVADSDEVRFFVWDGVVFEAMSPTVPMVTTSSFKSVEVQAYRESLYKSQLTGDQYLEANQQKAFHSDSFSSDAAFDPMMLRSDSKTHSVTTVCVGPDLVSMDYQATIGETRTLDEPVFLSIRRS